MIEFFKILLIYITRFFTRFLFILPVNNKRICFIAYGGRNYTCCPKYIYNELQTKHGNNFEYIWLLREPKSIVIEGVNTKKVKYLSFSYFVSLATAKYIISNYSMITRPPLRKKQVFINTWHGGGAYKKVGLTNIVTERKRTDITFNILAKDTTWFISSSQIFTDVMSETMRMPKSKFLNIGMPRNDIFFTDYSQTVKKVHDFYNIPEETKILLYAPTYRGESGNFSENVQLDAVTAINALEEKFDSKFVCIYRGHYYIHEQTVNQTINASDYPDMQELLCAADVLITDFSSSMWDFSLTKKPCFLFAPDLKEYESTREFYTPPEKWGFSVACTNNELIKNIETFNKQIYLQNVEENHKFFGSYDNGNASSSLISKIIK